SLRVSKVPGGAAPSPVQPRSISVCGGQRMPRPCRQHLGRLLPGKVARSSPERLRGILDRSRRGGRETPPPAPPPATSPGAAHLRPVRAGEGEMERRRLRLALGREGDDHPDAERSSPHPAVEEAVIGSDPPPHLLLVEPNERSRACRRRLNPYLPLPPRQRI